MTSSENFDPGRIRSDPGRYLGEPAPMTAIAIAPRFNTGDKKDATGAFIPEARRFLVSNGMGPLLLFDNRQSMCRRRKQAYQFLDENAMLEPPLIGIFCHGWKSGIQLGFRRWSSRFLADRIVALGHPAPRIFLAACSTAQGWGKEEGNRSNVGGEGGFADKLRDNLVARGIMGGWVDAHTTLGHTTRNPYVRRFYMDPEGTYGAEWLVRPGSRLWARWRIAVRGAGFRVRFTAMERDDIVRKLLA